MLVLLHELGTWGEEAGLGDPAVCYTHEESEVLVVSLTEEVLEIFRDPLLGPNLSS